MFLLAFFSMPAPWLLMLDGGSNSEIPEMRPMVMVWPCCWFVQLWLLLTLL